MKTICILIPALNEEKTIGQVIDTIPKNIHDIEQVKIIVVDDGSTDSTGKIANDKGCIVIKHKQNLGLGIAFNAGLQKALELKANILVTIDADGQFDTSEIPKLIKPVLDDEADFVIGSRFMDRSKAPENMPWIKKWGNHRVADIVSWCTGKKIHDVSCGFRAYGQEAMLRLNLFGKFTYTQETLLDLAFRGVTIKEVPVSVKYFKDRKSRVANNIFDYASKAGKIILKTIKDYRPFEIFGSCGILLFLIGLGLDMFVLHHYILTNSFFPYKIIGFLGAFLNATGIMIFFLGMLADIIDKVRLTQEKILYEEKKRKYEQ